MLTVKFPGKRQANLKEDFRDFIQSLQVMAWMANQIRPKPLKINLILNILRALSSSFNPLTPNDLYKYMSRTAPLTSKRYILYIYSTNVGTEYFKHALYSPFFCLQNAVCFIMLTSLVPVLFTFYIQVCRN